METSNSKGTWSVARSKQISRDLPQSPSHVQSPLRSRTQGGAGDAGPSKLHYGNSPLAQFGIPGKDKNNQNHRLQADSTDVKPVMLPGFQNAFAAPSPAPPKRLDKGKGREVDLPGPTQDFPGSQFQPPASFFFQHSTPRNPGLPRRTVDADTRMHDLGQPDDQAHVPSTKGSIDEDVDMLADDSDEPQPFYVGNSIEPYSWKAEVFIIWHFLDSNLLTHSYSQPHQIILTHSYSSNMAPTLQILMSTIPSDVDAYRAACANLLDVLSSMPRLFDLSALCDPLLSMAHILNATHLVG